MGPEFESGDQDGFVSPLVHPNDGRPVRRDDVWPPLLPVTRGKINMDPLFSGVREVAFPTAYLSPFIQRQSFKRLQSDTMNEEKSEGGMG